MSFFIFTPLANAAEEKMIIINKKTNQLGYYKGGVLQKVFPVATGRQRSYTPEGQFKVANKMTNPPYYKKHIPGGSPYNPLGTRWLGLSAAGYGIHGNSNENSIGTYASAGCIRLHNSDILWLYDQIPVGTPVIIVWNDTDLNSGFIDSRPIKVYFNNMPVSSESEYKAFSQQDRPFIPLKLLCNVLGYDIKWNSELQSIDLEKDGSITRLIPNSKIVRFNENSSTLTEPPIVVDGITYVTKSTMEEIFLINANWVTGSRDMYIVSRPDPEAAVNTSNENSVQENVDQGSQDVNTTSSGDTGTKTEKGIN